MARRTTDTAAFDPNNDPSTTTDEERPAFELSLTQMIAGTAAAMTAALLGSRLGVAGTLIGAALASAVSMIASAIYSHSIKSAKHRMKVALHHAGPPTRPLDTADLPTGALPLVPVVPDDTQLAFGQAPPARMPLDSAPPTATHTVPARTRRTRRRLPTMVLAGVGALAAFGMSLILLTGIETVSGTPLSGGESGGLTILGGQPTGEPDQNPIDINTNTGTDTDTEQPASTTSETPTGTSTTTTVTETVTTSDDPSSSSSTTPTTSSSTSGSSTSSSSTSTTTTSTSSSTPPSDPATTAEATATGTESAGTSTETTDGR